MAWGREDSGPLPGLITSARAVLVLRAAWPGPTGVKRLRRPLPMARIRAGYRIAYQEQIIASSRSSAGFPVSLCSRSQTSLRFLTLLRIQGRRGQAVSQNKSILSTEENFLAEQPRGQCLGSVVTTAVWEFDWANPVTQTRLPKVFRVRPAPLHSVSGTTGSCSQQIHTANAGTCWSLGGGHKNRPP